VAQTKHFEFGRNWTSFLGVIDESRVRAAEDSLIKLLDPEQLEGRSFLDIGCGSGLFSLAARRLGASVVSFDVDPQSAACARELRERFCADDRFWSIHTGSVLDRQHMMQLGQFDVVYAWGVLHHTGSMWQALDDTLNAVSGDGQLVLGIYNDQGWKSQFWLRVKKTYCSGRAGRLAILCTFIPAFIIARLCFDLVRLRNPMRLYIDYRRERGMSIVHDWRDWLGGLPFEVAEPQAVIDFCRRRGAKLTKVINCGNRLGNNQFVFLRCGPDSST
jgi:SAM-dependent methyltransferase